MKSQLSNLEREKSDEMDHMESQLSSLKEMMEKINNVNNKDYNDSYMKLMEKSIELNNQQSRDMKQFAEMKLGLQKMLDDYKKEMQVKIKEMKD